MPDDLRFGPRRWVPPGSTVFSGAVTTRSFGGMTPEEEALLIQRADLTAEIEALKEELAEARASRTEVPPPVLHVEQPLLKIDLACGQTPAEGFRGWDLISMPGVHLVDLDTYPWPAADGSVDELRCSHYIEHIPMEFVGVAEEQRVSGRDTPYGGDYEKDRLFAFFDEAYRIAKVGAKFTVIWPALQSVRAFQDPTHRRFIPAETMFYLDRDWRKANKLDHYNVVCNWKASIVPIVSSELAARTAEVQQREYVHFWNSVIDFQAVLTKAE